MAISVPWETALPISVRTGLWAAGATTPENGARTSMRPSSASAASSWDRALDRAERDVSSWSRGRFPLLTRRSVAANSVSRWARSWRALSTADSFALGIQAA